MKPLLLFATFEEAEASLELFQPRSLKPWLYESEHWYLMITGIGSFHAYIACKTFIDQVDHIANFGLAGALKPTFELGSLHEISSVSKLLWHPKGIEAASPFCHDIILKNSGPTLISSDMPVYNQTLTAKHDLVDMEAYAAAIIAQQHNKRCTIYKVVSDHCTPESATQIRQNLKKYSDTLASRVATIKIL